MPTTSLESSKNHTFEQNQSSLVKSKLKKLCKKGLQKMCSAVLAQFLTKIFPILLFQLKIMLILLNAFFWRPVLQNPLSVFLTKLLVFRPNMWFLFDSKLVVGIFDVSGVSMLTSFCSVTEEDNCRRNFNGETFKTTI